MWANSFLLSLAEETEIGDCRKKFKKKGFGGKINLSNYTIQKGIKHLEKNNIEEAEILFKKAMNESPELGMAYKYLGDIKYLKEI